MSDKPFHVHQLCHSQDACILNRMLLPARYLGDQLLKDDNIHVTCNDALPSGSEFDVSVYHGSFPGFEKIIGIATRWQINGRAFCWSVDDDYHCIPSWNPVQLSESMQTVALWTARSANHILCSTRPLAATFSPRPNVYVAPNLIEPQRYTPDERSSPIIRVMFAGSNTHVGDLEQMVEVVTDTLSKYDHVEFVFFGCHHKEIRRRHLYDGVIEWPHSPMKDYWGVLQSMSPDIWVCPLVDCRFSESKSNLKVLEGFALKAAVIASDVHPYRDTIESGQNGVLVDPENPQEWTEALALLIEDASLRKRMAAAGRDTVEQRYNWQRAECRQPWVDYFRALRVPF